MKAREKKVRKIKDIDLLRRPRGKRRIKQNPDPRDKVSRKEKEEAVTEHQRVP